MHNRGCHRGLPKIPKVLEIRPLQPLFGTEVRGVGDDLRRRYDLVIRDRRFTIHRGGPLPVDRRRSLARATVAGDAPTAPQ